MRDERDDANTPTAPQWARADGCLQAFERLFAPARNLMDNHFLPLSEARPARAFLRGLEALVRRLLLVRALVLLPDLAASRPGMARPGKPHPGKPRRTARSAPADLPEAPEDWPVRFAYRLTSLLPAPDEAAPAPPPRTPRARPCHVGCAIKAQLGRRNPCPPLCPKLKTIPDPDRAWVRSAPTALRVEALRRIIETPETYARRMARLLRRHAADAAASPSRRLRLGPAPHLHADHQRFFMVALEESGRLAASGLEASPPSAPDTS